MQGSPDEMRLVQKLPGDVKFVVTRFLWNSTVIPGCSLNQLKRRSDRHARNVETEGEERSCKPNTQICPGSSGSGSRTGASGFSNGFGGSLIGAGEGSGGVRKYWPTGEGNFNCGSIGMVFRGMVFRCHLASRGWLKAERAVIRSDQLTSVADPTQVSQPNSPSLEVTLEPESTSK